MSVQCDKRIRGHYTTFQSSTIKGSWNLLYIAAGDCQKFLMTGQTAAGMSQSLHMHSLSLSHNSLCSAVDQRPLTITVIKHPLISGGSQYTTHMLLWCSGYHSNTALTRCASSGHFLYTCCNVITINAVVV